QRAILAGDDKTGITIMQMDEGLDTGAILAAEEIAIGPATTSDALHDQLAALGADLAIDVLDRLDEGEITAAPQAQDGACTAPKLTRAEGRLDWRADAAALERKVRAFSPWPGAWFEVNGTRIKVLAAEVVAVPEGGPPGVVLDGRLTIACGAGGFRVLRAQREGRKAQGAEELLRGFAMPKGTALSLPDETRTEGAS
ncbi:MAG: methionyl-tRNA formyltransferase, partial [Alphaproteobacteria bacterium]